MFRPFILFLALTMPIAAAHAQGADHAEGLNSSYDPHIMDTNGDGTITKEEYMHYQASYWTVLCKGNATVSVDAAAAAFARDNMKLDADAMDIGHNGVVSRAEFMRYSVTRFDQAKNQAGIVTIDVAWIRFARTRPSTTSSPNRKDTGDSF